jgi:hypothetical protein
VMRCARRLPSTTADAVAPLCHLDNADPPGRVTVHPGRDALDDHRVILDDSDRYLTFHLASTHSTSSSR